MLLPHRHDGDGDSCEVNTGGGGGMLTNFSYKIAMVASFLISRKIFLKFIGVKYGDGCRFIGLRPSTFGSEPYLVSIGDHVTITSGVKFINHDGGVWVLRKKYPQVDVVERITIGSNVFIGMNSIILPGVSIGDNCVVGAGSVVTGTLAPNSIYAGVPARRIRGLDEYEQNVLKKGMSTKGMNRANKRKFFEEHFLRNQ